MIAVKQRCLMSAVFQELRGRRRRRRDRTTADGRLSSQERMTTSSNSWDRIGQLALIDHFTKSRHTSCSVLSAPGCQLQNWRVDKRRFRPSTVPRARCGNAGRAPRPAFSSWAGDRGSCGAWLQPPAVCAPMLPKPRPTAPPAIAGDVARPFAKPPPWMKMKPPGR